MRARLNASPNFAPIILSTFFNAAATSALSDRGYVFPFA
jgi:hypothetical protein